MTPAERLTVVRYRAGLDGRDWALVAKYHEETRRRRLVGHWAAGAGLVALAGAAVALLPLVLSTLLCGLLGLPLGALIASARDA